MSYIVSIVFSSNVPEAEIKAALAARLRNEETPIYFMPARDPYSKEVMIERDEFVDALLARSYMPEPRHIGFVSAAVSHLLADELSGRVTSKTLEPLIKALKQGKAAVYGAQAVYDQVLANDREYTALQAEMLAAAA